MHGTCALPSLLPPGDVGVTSGGCPTREVGPARGAGARVVYARDGVSYRERLVYADCATRSALDSIDWEPGWRMRLSAVPQQTERFGTVAHDLPFAVVDNRTTLVYLRLLPDLACNADEETFVRECIDQIDPAVAGQYHATATIEDGRLFLLPAFSFDGAGFQRTLGGVTYQLTRSYVTRAWHVVARRRGRPSSATSPAGVRTFLAPSPAIAATSAGREKDMAREEEDEEEADDDDESREEDEEDDNEEDTRAAGEYGSGLAGAVAASSLSPAIRAFPRSLTPVLDPETVDRINRLHTVQRAGELQKEGRLSPRDGAQRPSPSPPRTSGRTRPGGVPLWYGVPEGRRTAWIDARLAGERPGHVHLENGQYVVPAFYGDPERPPPSPSEAHGPLYMPIDWDLSADDIDAMRREYIDAVGVPPAHLPKARVGPVAARGNASPGMSRGSRAHVVTPARARRESSQTDTAAKVEPGDTHLLAQTSGAQPQPGAGIKGMASRGHGGHLPWHLWGWDLGRTDTTFRDLKSADEAAQLAYLREFQALPYANVSSSRSEQVMRQLRSLESSKGPAGSAATTHLASSRATPAAGSAPSPVVASLERTLSSSTARPLAAGATAASPIRMPSPLSESLSALTSRA